MDEFVGQLGPFVGALIVLFIFVLGVLLIKAYGKNKNKAKDSTSWPSAPGVVTLSQVVRSVSEDEDGKSYSYEPQINYAYTINNKNYVSNQVVFGGMGSHGTVNKAQLAADKYPLNARVRVFYNPNNANEAVLETVAGSGAKGTLFGGILLLVVGLVMAVLLVMELLG